MTLFRKGHGLTILATVLGCYPNSIMVMWPQTMRSLSLIALLRMEYSFRDLRYSPTVWNPLALLYAGYHLSSLPDYLNDYGPGIFYSDSTTHLYELGFETPATPYPAFETPIGSVASDASFQHSLQTSPCPLHKGGRSYLDRRIALSRTQRSSYLMNTAVNTSSSESHGSA